MSSLSSLITPDIKGAELEIDVAFEKSTTMLTLNFDIKGKVMVMCDKCTDDFYLDVENKEELIYKFGEGVSDDEKIEIIPENEIEIDLTQPIYELTVIAIFLQKECIRKENVIRKCLRQWMII